MPKRTAFPRIGWRWGRPGKNLLPTWFSFERWIFWSWEGTNTLPTGHWRVLWDKSSTTTTFLQLWATQTNTWQCVLTSSINGTRMENARMMMMQENQETRELLTWRDWGCRSFTLKENSTLTNVSCSLFWTLASSFFLFHARGFVVSFKCEWSLGNTLRRWLVSLWQSGFKRFISSHQRCLLLQPRSTSESTHNAHLFRWVCENCNERISWSDRWSSHEHCFLLYCLHC